jgi:hypothetical protein
MPLLPVPEAAPETPVAKVEALVMVMDASVSEELPEWVERLPLAEVVLEPDLEALEEEEEESAVGGLSVLSAVDVLRIVQSSNIQMVSPASSQTSLKYLEAASSWSPQFLEM